LPLLKSQPAHNTA